MRKGGESNDKKDASEKEIMCERCLECDSRFLEWRNSKEKRGIEVEFRQDDLDDAWLSCNGT